jgi:hypothetical protein
MGDLFISSSKDFINGRTLYNGRLTRKIRDGGEFLRWEISFGGSNFICLAGSRGFVNQPYPVHSLD